MTTRQVALQELVIGLGPLVPGPVALGMSTKLFIAYMHTCRFNHRFSDILNSAAFLEHPTRQTTFDNRYSIPWAIPRIVRQYGKCGISACACNMYVGK
jgi:hypothetical protein